MPTPQYSVEGQTTVVTGSSRGIGKTIAAAFVDSGADVVLCAPEADSEALERTATSLSERSGDGKALAVPCDVTDRTQVEALVEATIEAFGIIDTLVNNAGGGPLGAFESVEMDQWRRVVDLNLHGVYNCTQIAGSEMRETGGSIVNIASVAGLKGSTNMAPYSAAKAGVINLTKTLGFEWSSDDIRVNAIAPGLVATERIISERSSISIPPAEEIDRSTVARRVGKPEEVADAVQFLASPAASFVTGTVLRVAGVPRLERHLEVQQFGPDELSWL